MSPSGSASDTPRQDNFSIMVPRAYETDTEEVPAEGASEESAGTPE
jgi:hypothetical protein